MQCYPRNCRNILRLSRSYSTIMQSIYDGEAITSNISNDGVHNNKGSKPRLPPMPTIGQILRIYKVGARKRLAQNFLLDHSINYKLVNVAGRNLEGHHVCEVGPGPGGITRAVLNLGAERLTVVEKDSRFYPSLQYLSDAVEGKLNIVLGDILKYNMEEAFPESLAKEWDDDIPAMRVIGNLPFNVSLPLLFKLLDAVSLKSSLFTYGRIPLIFTFQQEVGERLFARPNHHQRCRISVTTQTFCDVQYSFTIKGASFTPEPKVNAAVIKLTPRKEFITNLQFKTVDHVAKHVFHFRQKYCVKGIASLFPPKRVDLTNEIIRISGVDPQKRPFELTNKHFRDLSYAFSEIVDKIPQIALVDSYGPKDWLKYFDSSGEPL